MEKGAEDFVEAYYEAYGPHGIAYMIQVVTDNRNRTISEMRRLFNRAGGNLAEIGAVSWQFKTQGQVYSCQGGHTTSVWLKMWDGVLTLNAEWPGGRANRLHQAGGRPIGRGVVPGEVPDEGHEAGGRVGDPAVFTRHSSRPLVGVVAVLVTLTGVAAGYAATVSLPDEPSPAVAA